MLVTLLITINSFFFIYFLIELIKHQHLLALHNYFIIAVIGIIYLIPLIIEFDPTRRSGMSIFTILIILAALIEYSLNISSGLIEVGEQVPDATLYLIKGHWEASLKNPYYDIINVASFWIAILHKIMGVSNTVYALPNLILYVINALLIYLSIFIAFKMVKAIDALKYVPAIIFLTPYITLITVPPALSAAYALIFLAVLMTRFFEGLTLRWEDYLLFFLLAMAGVLTHATFAAMTIFALLLLELVRGFIHVLIHNDVFKTRIMYSIALLLLTYISLTLIRFFYTTAYVSLYPYYADFLRFLNFLSGTGETIVRLTRYEEASPLITAYSWTLLPSFATAYVIYYLLRIRKLRVSRVEMLSLSLITAGLLLIVLGFIGSMFSNSFSREAGYPGYMLLLLGSFEPLKKINANKYSRVVLLILLVMGLISGAFTIKNASQFYIGKVPFLSYSVPTPSEVSLVRTLVKMNIIEPSINIYTYSSFDPGLFSVLYTEIKQSTPIFTRIHSEPINNLEQLLFHAHSIVLNSNSLVISI